MFHAHQGISDNAAHHFELCQIGLVLDSMTKKDRERVLYLKPQDDKEIE